jgi:hypothetical protein
MSFIRLFVTFYNFLCIQRKPDEPLFKLKKKKNRDEKKICVYVLEGV